AVIGDGNTVSSCVGASTFGRPPPVPTRNAFAPKTVKVWEALSTPERAVTVTADPGLSHGAFGLNVVENCPAPSVVPLAAPKVDCPDPVKETNCPACGRPWGSFTVTVMSESRPADTAAGPVIDIATACDADANAGTSDIKDNADTVHAAPAIAVRRDTPRVEDDERSISSTGGNSMVTTISFRSERHPTQRQRRRTSRRSCAPRPTAQAHCRTRHPHSRHPNEAATLPREVGRRCPRDLA
ncbi:MAG: hypothetical protein K0R81_1735, partial [Microbacterium sp.]|nr:hypothetical protein [Microbacterium sp.]